MNARRHSPAVYRRRRLMVLLIALIVIAGLIWLFVARPWSAFGGAQAEPAPAVPAASDSPQPADQDDSDAPDESEKEASGTEAEGKDEGDSSDSDGPLACDPKAITVEPMTDKREYGDEKPKLTMTLKNTGDEDCTLNVGTTQQVFTVTSGGDVWWRSTDCQKEPSDMEVTLKAGQEVSSAEAVAWDRTRSDVETCGEKKRPVAPGGGASYQLRVQIGEVTSEFTRQFILR